MVLASLILKRIVELGYIVSVTTGPTRVLTQCWVAGGGYSQEERLQFRLAAWNHIERYVVYFDADDEEQTYRAACELAAKVGIDLEDG